MTELTKEEIATLSQLSRINCTDQEIENLHSSFTQIIHTIDTLKEVDTSDIEPCNHVLAHTHNALRDDIVGESLSHETFLSNTPSHTEGLVKVPSILTQQ